MKSTEIIAVTLSNGDQALYVNGNEVLTVEAWEKGASPVDVGKQLACALGVELREARMDIPADPDWNWRDVYELLPPAPVKSDSVEIRHWDAYDTPGTSATHQVVVSDKRHLTGQLFVDIEALDGNLDDMISVTMEVGTNPLNGIAHVPCAHVHFDSDNLALSLFKVGSNKILLRPEAGIVIEAFNEEVYGLREKLYWIQDGGCITLPVLAPPMLRDCADLVQKRAE